MWSRMSKKELYFKCENFQKTGSFKARGALNAIKTSVEKGMTMTYFIINIKKISMGKILFINVIL